MVFRSPVLEQMHSLPDTSEFLSQKQTLESAHTCFNHKSFSENIQQSNFKLFEHLSFHFHPETAQILPTLLGFSLRCTVHLLFSSSFGRHEDILLSTLFETHLQSSAATSSIHNLVYGQIGSNAPSKDLVNCLKMIKLLEKTVRNYTSNTVFKTSLLACRLWYLFSQLLLYFKWNFI